METNKQTRSEQITEAHALLTRIARGVIENEYLFDGVGGFMLEPIEKWAIAGWRDGIARLALLTSRCGADLRARICFSLTLILACGKCQYVHDQVGYFSRALARLDRGEPMSGKRRRAA